jgi:hypothetical protein
MEEYNLRGSVVYNRALLRSSEGSDDNASRRSGLTASKSLASVSRGIAGYSDSQRARINDLLGAWEEPVLLDKSHDAVNISSIIQFRQSLSCLNTPFPFSVAFGPADSREMCIQSVETVYRRLLLSTPGAETLNFEVLGLTARDHDGTLDEEKLKEIISLFRPDRDGNLTLLDFAKSVDSVYKELRLLRASVANSSKMDRAFERIINVAFYFVVGCIVLSVVR